MITILQWLYLSIIFGHNIWFLHILGIVIVVIYITYDIIKRPEDLDSMAFARVMRDSLIILLICKMISTGVLFYLLRDFKM